MSALYVHFPWCVAKCPYCDFNSHPLRGNLDQEAYVDALRADLAEQLGAAQPRFASVFLGGGTPSLFSADALAPLFTDLTPHLVPDAEVTLEANPGSQEYWDFGAYRRLGINRLSLGVQSFAPEQLRRLGRIHGPQEVVTAFAAARAGGFDNINLDLMYALPQQRVEGALDDLERAIALAPEHISWYQLTLEPKTEFARRPPQLPAEDTQVQIEELGCGRLARAGYARYEVSAYAREGRACRHNLNYWRFGDYVGIGAGAHGKQTRPGQVLRTSKASQPRLYLQNASHTSRTTVHADELAGEIAMNALRLVHGISARELNDILVDAGHAQGSTLQVQMHKRWQSARVQGLMQEGRFAATELGLRFLDTLVAEFLGDT